VYRFRLGDYQLTALYDGTWFVKIDDDFVRNARDADVNKALAAAFLPPNVLPVSFTVLLVNTGSKLVLFDTGFGDNGSPTQGGLLANMAAAGIDPNAVDVVIISHFHADHISGIRAKAGAANFRNAEIMVPAEEWAWWTNDSETPKAAEVWKGQIANSKRVFEPIAKEVKRFDYGKELVTGITSVDARGHSPGHSAFVIASGNAKLMYIADGTNHPAIFARHPEFRLWADMIPDLALTNRRKLLDMLAAERMPMTGYHYPFPAVGHIAKRGNGYDFHPASWQPVL
jgi:glyoxylase-like metal-dependent hydrolase (beta-lactamase superfamily II)